MAPSVIKIDKSKLVKMYFQNMNTEREIATYFDTSTAAVNKALKPFKALLKDSDSLQAYRDNRLDILDSIERELLRDMVDKGRRKKATLGNVAYAVDKIATHSRLERGLATQITDVVIISPEEERRLSVIADAAIEEMRKAPVIEAHPIAEPQDVVFGPLGFNDNLPEEVEPID